MQLRQSLEVFSNDMRLFGSRWICVSSCIHSFLCPFTPNTIWTQMGVIKNVTHFRPKKKNTNSLLVYHNMRYSISQFYDMEKILIKIHNKVLQNAKGKIPHSAPIQIYSICVRKFERWNFQLKTDSARIVVLVIVVIEHFLFFFLFAQPE